MLPALRAAVDRYVFDIANLKHAFALAPAEAMTARSVGTGRSVHETLAHVVGVQVAESAAIDRFARNQAVLTPDGDPRRACESAVAEFRRMDVPTLLGTLSESRDALIAACDRVRFARSQEPWVPELGPETVVQAVARWSHHIATHALDIVECVPSAIDDGVIVNWALWLHPPTADERWLERHAALVERVRAASAPKPAERKPPLRKRKKREVGT